MADVMESDAKESKDERCDQTSVVVRIGLVVKENNLPKVRGSSAACSRKKGSNCLGREGDGAIAG